MHMRHIYEGSHSSGRRSCTYRLGLQLSELARQAVGCLDPQQHDTQEDDAQVGGGCGQRAEADDHELLDQGTSRFAQRVADHINGGLTLGLDLRVRTQQKCVSVSADMDKQTWPWGCVGVPQHESVAAGRSHRYIADSKRLCHC